MIAVGLRMKKIFHRYKKSEVMIQREGGSPRDFEDVV